MGRPTGRVTIRRVFLVLLVISLAVVVVFNGNLTSQQLETARQVLTGCHVHQND